MKQELKTLIIFSLQVSQETPEEKFKRIQRSYLEYTSELKEDIEKITDLQEIEIFETGLEGQLEALLSQAEEMKDASRNDYKNLKKDARSGKFSVRKAERLYRSYRILYAALLEEVEEIEVRTRKVYERLQDNQ